MNLIPSKHFKQRLQERGITWEECEETIKTPNRKTQFGKGENGGVRHKYEKDFADKTVIVVVGETLPKTKNIMGITAWRKES